MEPHSAFNTLDYIVFGVVLLSGLLALIRGFMRELFSLIAWAGAYFATVKFYHLAVPMAHHYIKSDKAAEWAAMAGVFAAALIVLMLVGFAVCSLLIRGRALTAIDRSLGFAYGLARGALVVCVLYMVASIVLWPDIDAQPPAKAGERTAQQDKDRTMPPELLMQARTRPALAYGSNVLKSLIPKEMLDKTLKNVDERENEAEAKAKEEADKAANQKMLDKLSTPIPPPPGTDKKPIGLNAPANTESNP